jgi:hypothetical protein
MKGSWILPAEGPQRPFTVRLPRGRRWLPRPGRAGRQATARLPAAATPRPSFPVDLGPGMKSPTTLTVTIKSPSTSRITRGALVGPPSKNKSWRVPGTTAAWVSVAKWAGLLFTPRPGRPRRETDRPKIPSCRCPCPPGGGRLPPRRGSRLASRRRNRPTVPCGRAGG